MATTPSAASAACRSAPFFRASTTKHVSTTTVSARSRQSHARGVARFSNDAQTWVSDWVGREWTWNVYSGDDRLKVTQRSTFESESDALIHTVFSDYRYDALGRRVLARHRWDQYCQTAAPKCL